MAAVALVRDCWFGGRSGMGMGETGRKVGRAKRACAGTAQCRSDGASALEWFHGMIAHCLDYAGAAKAGGRPIVGIMCEYTPRELIMAAGGVPVCLCGGDAATIPAAETELPSNLCPLIKSTYGYAVDRANPFLEMADLIVAETTCDGKKKMYELMARRKPMYVLELTQKEDDAQAFRHWVGQLRALVTELERRFRVKISNANVRAAIRSMNEERRLRRSLAALMKSQGPPLNGRELLEFKSSISCIPADLAMYRLALRTLANHNGKAPTQAVRVLMTGVPIVHGAERVLDIVEERGGLVVCMENCTGVKPILDDVDEKARDPILALARKYYQLPCSVMTPNRARLDSLRRLARAYRPECVIELVWQACLTYDVESQLIRRFAEEKLGIPYLKIETDYSPSDSARIATRVEALFETVNGRRAGRGGRSGGKRRPRAVTGRAVR